MCCFLQCPLGSNAIHISGNIFAVIYKIKKGGEKRRKTSSRRNMKKVFSKRITSIMLVLTMLIGILSLTGCSVIQKLPFFGKTLNLNDYLLYTVSGYDGYGELEFNIDDAALSEDIAEIKGTDTFTVYDLVRNIRVDMKGSWDKTSELSNGDTINFRWNVDEKRIKDLYGIKVTCKDISEKVSGLKEVQKVDVFNNMEVSVTGIAPDGYLNKISFPDYPGIRATADKYSDLSNGDVITITIESSPESTLETYGMVPEKSSTTYTVSELSEYVAKVADIPEDIKSQILAQLDDFVVSMYAGDEKKSINGYEVLGYYLLSPKQVQKSLWSEPAHNQLYVVYQPTITTKLDGGKTETVTPVKYIRYENLIKYADGTGYVDILDYSYPVKGGWSYYGDEEYYFTSAGGVDYAGFKDYDTFVNQCITKQKEAWIIDTDMQ